MATTNPQHKPSSFSTSPDDLQVSSQSRKKFPAIEKKDEQRCRGELANKLIESKEPEKVRLGVESLEELASEGYAPAQVLLGCLHTNGVLGDDPIKAFNYFLDAAEQGDPWGQHNLGLIYEANKPNHNQPNQIQKEVGVQFSLQKAEEWYSKAATQTFEPSMEALMRLEKYRKESFKRTLHGHAHLDTKPLDCKAKRRSAVKCLKENSHLTGESLFLVQELLYEALAEGDLEAFHHLEKHHLFSLPRMQKLCCSSTHLDFINTTDSFDRMKRKIYEKGARTGVPIYQFKLARMHEEGIYKSQYKEEKAKKALLYYRILADQGDRESLEAVQRLTGSAPQAFPHFPTKTAGFLSNGRAPCLPTRAALSNDSKDSEAHYMTAHSSNGRTTSLKGRTTSLNPNAAAFIPASEETKSDSDFKPDAVDARSDSDVESTTMESKSDSNVKPGSMETKSDSDVDSNGDQNDVPDAATPDSSISRLPGFSVPIIHLYNQMTKTQNGCRNMQSTVAPTTGARPLMSFA